MRKLIPLINSIYFADFMIVQMFKILNATCLFLLMVVLSAGNGADAQVPDSLHNIFYKEEPAKRLTQLVERAAAEQRKNNELTRLLLLSALPLADSLQNPLKKMEILNELGSIYLQRDEYGVSQEYLQSAQKIGMAQRADTLLIDTYTYLGINFERTGKYADALEWLGKAGELQQRLNTGPEQRARNLTNIAHVYEEQQLFKKAIDTYTIALKLCQDYGITFGEALISQNLANTHNALNMYDESIKLSNQSLEIALRENMTRIIVAAYQNLGASYVGQKKYAEAIASYEKALDQGRKINYSKAILDASIQLCNIHETLGNISSAFTYYKMHTALKDSVFTVEKTQKIEALQAEFKSEQKEAAIKELKQENQLANLKQQKTFFILLFSIALATIIIWALWYRQKQASIAAQQREMLKDLEQQKALENLERDKVLYELNTLKAQMNPHFLFNALNSIQELFVSGDKRKANDYMGKFSDLTRAILHASGKPAIPLEEEIQMLRDYLDLEGLRFDGRFSYEVSADDKALVEDILIPPMLVQPYVENAIKHGLMHKTGNRYVHIRFSMAVHQILQVQIKDNGIGRKQAAYYATLRHGKHNSFATSATQKRLELLNHGREAAITVKYEDVMEEGIEAGTCVTIQIPVYNE